jgi:hypothetical protein
MFIVSVVSTPNDLLCDRIALTSLVMEQVLPFEVVDVLMMHVYRALLKE